MYQCTTDRALERSHAEHGNEGIPRQRARERVPEEKGSICQRAALAGRCGDLIDNVGQRASKARVGWPSDIRAPTLNSRVESIKRDKCTLIVFWCQ
jgi:hypothetical protein